MIALLLALGLHAAPAVELPASARTPGARIVLGDLFPGATLPAGLAEVDLGRAPSPGFGRVLTREAILAALPAGALEIAGREVEVHADVARIAAADVLAAAERELRAQVSVPADAELEVVRRPFDTQVPKGRTGVELRPRLGRIGTDHGVVPLVVDVAVDGGVQLAVPVTFRLRTFASVLALAVDLGRGEVLRPEHVATRRVETTSRSAPAAVDAIAFVGSVARRSLRAGEVLSGDDFEAPLLVRKNESVTLVFERGALRAESFGIARESGALGAVVRVENLVTKKRLAGRVAGPGLIAMNPEAAAGVSP